MSIKIIACIDMGFAIGNGKGDLLFHLPKDLQHFKSITTGKTVVMGRNTWESLPESVRPLPKRKNFILTRDESYVAEGATVIHSIEEVLEMSKSRDIFICGGGEIYKEFMPYADALIITHVHVVNIQGRVFFPDIDPKEWNIKSMVKHEEDDKHEHSFTFTHYVRGNKQQEKTNNE